MDSEAQAMASCDRRTWRLRFRVERMEKTCGLKGEEGVKLAEGPSQTQRWVWWVWGQLGRGETAAWTVGRGEAWLWGPVELECRNAGLGTSMTTREAGGMG